MSNNDDGFQPVSIGCIMPHIFPKVSLYTRISGHYVLYTSHEREFTTDDLERTKSNDIKFLFVRSGDFKTVTKFAEENMDLLMDRDDVDNKAKGMIIYQASTQYISELLHDPSRTEDSCRCKTLVRHLSKHFSDKESIMDSIKTIANSVPYILKHSVQVSCLSILAYSTFFDTEYNEIIDVGIGGLLHDIGMSLVDRRILEKKEVLTLPDINEVRKHPFEGYVLLKKTGAYEGIPLKMVRHHHERFIGGGYPGGLSGDEIPRSAQVACICDVYCALTADRPHRPASTSEEALNIMQSESGLTFNPDLFEKFKKIL
jgi:HD-GYP domain-containing protein (c-di-GMP phosphodiesterase class II)